MTYSLADVEAELPSAEMNDLVKQILASSLRSIGLLEGGARTLGELSREGMPAPFYERWLLSTIAYLRQEKLLSVDGTLIRDVRQLSELWDEWKTLRSDWASGSNQRAQTVLLEACLEALPAILSGKRRATDVMFPNSSMQLVEGIYRGNPQASYFNDVLRQALSARIAERLRIDDGLKIRILEIGAGTGGTTAALLPELHQFPIEEYCYSDLSKAFLMYGEKHFQPEFPALRTAIFDVSTPPESQSISSNHYDYVIAANVLHATVNIRETLRNVKAVLKNEGMLLLNEIGAWSLFNHLTFGLLEGWWLYEDSAVRLDGSPGLSSEMWREVLAEEGFESISFPAEEAHGLGQQIVVAVSNGWTRRRIARPTLKDRAAASPRMAPVLKDTAGGRAFSSPTSAEPTEQAIAAHTRQIVAEKLADALRMDKTSIRNDALFADYGVDSIIGVNLIHTINEALRIELETTALFEYSTVQELTGYIVSSWSERIAAQVPRARGLSPEEVPSSVVPNDRTLADYVRGVVISQLSESLSMDAAAILNDASFADYGVDSIIGVELIRSINETLKIELETTTLFEYGTVEQLSEHILGNWRERIVGQMPRAREALPRSDPAAGDLRTESPSRPRFGGPGRLARTREVAGSADVSQKASIEPIAIIGMSGRFAESESIHQFWTHLEKGEDLVKPVTRWNPADCVISDTPITGYCSHGSFIDSIDQFDASFFGIPSVEATYMDPQQRLFLEESWRALEDAGYVGGSVHERQCGVYVGCGGSNYDKLVSGEAPAEAFWGNSQAVTPARIAYTLNLQGPAIAVDTACSSSLVAIHLACQGLWSRETEMALAGGVFLQPTPGFYQVANRSSMLSPDGKCYSFDSKANGFVPGEGVGVVVLKRLDDALAAGDHIHGVIAGSGINQDGRSNGLIAPNGRAQERLELSVYGRFGIDPATIQVVEAHGTGTLMGDSLEFGAISRAFREYTDKKQFCAIGTVKTNIGHTSTSAGVAGVLKLLLSMKHRMLPPSLHFEKANPAIEFESSPFYVNTELKAWDVGVDGVRRAAVSSFGFGGTNAHLVLEEAPAIACKDELAPGYLIVVSARSREELNQQVRNLLDHLEQTPNLSMNDLSFTLFAGRMHLKHRIACLAHNQEEAIRLFEQWLATGAAAQVWSAEIQDGRTSENESLARLVNRTIHECRDATSEEYLENLGAIADLFVRGYALEFEALFPAGSKRIPLPTYPFARERYWIDGGAGTALPAPAAPASSRLHPLLHRNTSTLGRQSYCSTLANRESFEATCLEMTRAALVEAMCVPEGSVIELQDVAWGESFAGGDVTVALFAGDDHVLYEISGDEISGDRAIYCQGRAVFVAPSTPVAMNDAQPLARLSADDRDGEYALPPSFINAVLRAAGPGANVKAIERLRILSACSGEMSVYTRRANEAIDIDLIDPNGNLAVQIRGLSFRSDSSVQRRWIFSKGQDGAAVSMSTEEKAALFLRQEIALQLQKTIDEVPTDVSFFDLGMTSLGMANLVQNICAMIEAELAPSVLFDYRDIDSLASYLAMTYASPVDEIAVAQSNGDAHAAEPEVNPVRLTPIAQTPRLSIKTEQPLDEVLESVSWCQSSLEEGYEKVTI